MSFLKPGTPINKDTLDEAVEAIALSCARGVRQHQAIVLLIETGKLETELVRVPGNAPGKAWTRLVHSFPNGLSYESWKGISKRLVAAGFTIKRTRVGETGGTRYELFWGPSEEPDVPLVQQKDSAAAELRLENNKGGRA